MSDEDIILNLFSRVVECSHENLRCVHGDEIIYRGYARVACTDCGTSLYKTPMPELCYYSGEKHTERKNRD